MSKLKGFRKSEIAQWTLMHRHPDAIVVSDGLACFKAVAEARREHYAIVTGRYPSSVMIPELGWVNTIIGNVKNAPPAPTTRSAASTFPDTSRCLATDSAATSSSKS